jgi:hypothetical protein
MRNANHELFGIVGVEPVAVIHTEDGEIDSDSDSDEDDDKGIIAISNVPPPVAQDPLVLSDSSDDEQNDDDHSDDDSEDDDDDDPSFADAVAEQDDSGDDEDKEQGDQGVRRSRHKNKGINRLYDNYTLMMHGRRKARGGQRRATIRDGVCFFSAEDLSDAKPVPEEDRDEYALGVALITYGIGPGIKKFQEQGEAGVTKELTQMHDMDVFRPIMKGDLTMDERKKALASLMFLKEKRDQSVKVRMCVDGRGQQGDWSKQDTTSPTVSTESVFITAVIDAHEGRDVACFDIPGAFLHADSDEDITMILKGRLAELMVQVAPNLYRQYITIDWKGKAILYVKM